MTAPTQYELLEMQLQVSRATHLMTDATRIKEFVQTQQLILDMAGEEDDSIVAQLDQAMAQYDQRKAELDDILRYSERLMGRLKLACGHDKDWQPEGRIISAVGTF